METQTQTQSPNDPGLFRILVATDTHVGFKERDPIRVNDSFDVFDEIMHLGRALNVDFILHGGDLFDLHKPSRNTLYSVMNILRETCFANPPPVDNVASRMVVLNAETRKKVFKFGTAAFETGQHNVTLPVLGIHGNHDDPGEEAFLASVDLLEAAGMLTYFGWVQDLEKIEVHPVLLQKENTKIALYGLGNIRDERLHRLFNAGKVKFQPPESGTSEEYFNLMAIHQNRYKGAFGGIPNRNCIHETMLPRFLDLVIWGHEHDCVLSTTESVQADFHVIQPGSSLATSLSRGEAVLKHVVVLEIKGDKFRSTFIPLCTNRPLLFKELSLAEANVSPTDAAIMDFLNQEVEALLVESKYLWRESQELWRKQLIETVWPTLNLPIENLTDFLAWMDARRQTLGVARSASNSSGQDHNPSAPLPLVRLRVEHSGFLPILSQRFGAKFVGRVANPDDIISWFKRRKGDPSALLPTAKNVPELEITDAVDETLGVQVQDLNMLAFDEAASRHVRCIPPCRLLQVFKYLEDQKQSLEIIPEPELNVAVQEYVHKGESSAVDRVVSRILLNVRHEVKQTDQVFQTPEQVRAAVVDRTSRARSELLTQAIKYDENAEAERAEIDKKLFTDDPIDRFSDVPDSIADRISTTSRKRSPRVQENASNSKRRCDPKSPTRGPSASTTSAGVVVAASAKKAVSPAIEGIVEADDFEMDSRLEATPTVARSRRGGLSATARGRGRGKAASNQAKLRCSGEKPISSSISRGNSSVVARPTNEGSVFADLERSLTDFDQENVSVPESREIEGKQISKSDSTTNSRGAAKPRVSPLHPAAKRIPQNKPSPKSLQTEVATSSTNVAAKTISNNRSRMASIMSKLKPAGVRSTAVSQQSSLTGSQINTVVADVTSVTNFPVNDYGLTPVQTSTGPAYGALTTGRQRNTTAAPQRKSAATEAEALLNFDDDDDENINSTQDDNTPLREPLTGKLTLPVDDYEDELLASLDI